MNSKSLMTGLGIAGGALGIIGGVMNIYQLADEMKNGVKLRKDQMDYIAAATAVNVTNHFIDNLDDFAAVTAKKLYEQMNIK